MDKEKLKEELKDALSELDELACLAEDLQSSFSTLFSDAKHLSDRLANMYSDFESTFGELMEEEKEEENKDES